MNSFPGDSFGRNLSPDPKKPYKLHHCGEENGLLSDIQPDEDCIIVTIDGRKVVLSPELQARLEPFIGHNIGLANFFDTFYIRELDA